MNEPRWLTRELVIAIQSELIAEHGGRARIRDEALLESALARPQNARAYGRPSLAELGAAYCFGLARNHPFVDGNKRTALAALDVFLLMNGHELDCPEPEAVHVILELAAGRLTEAELAAWVADRLQGLLSGA
jgi:death on curing protein